jgi:hypothetical protein
VIDEALGFLTKQLTDHFSKPSGEPEPVGFLDRDDMNPIKFKHPITVLLINIEQETVLRTADPYKRIAADGSAYQTRPDIRLNLCLLFVAGYYKDYTDSLRTISRIIRYFQSHPVFETSSVGRLTMELLTLPLAEQNELWSALGTPYRPSVLYRVRMLVFEDRHETSTVPVSEIEMEIVRAHHAAS